ncbi:MAG: DUF2156 domain-containing protein, partial [Spirochaetaceae bacterium]|nr:DUF2156 domain-containing protein [Spirochaetaceae bacterium]
MIIPNFPDFVPVTLELKRELHPHLSLTPDGVSEYTFSNIYLFRNRYQYRVSRVGDCFVISGVQPAHAPDASTDGISPTEHVPPQVP